MPIYTYRCENCGVQFDRQQSYQDAPLKVCPECRKRALKKVIAPVGIVFKGSGFYSTDHRSSSGSSTRSSRKDESKKEESKPDTSSKPDSSSSSSE
ncbi:MAG TPA: FmdB family zinc ribbon protein [Anaerolineales bacterium]